MHPVVPAKGDGARPLLEWHAVVQKLVVDPLVGAQRPGEEQPRHAGIGLDIMGQEIVDRLVAAELQAALPGALDRGFRRRHHEEHVDHRAEAGQQPRAFLAARRLGEAVEAEPVDHQMRHADRLGFARHGAVELLVDDLQLVAGQAAGIAAGRAEAVIVEQIFAPDIRADQGEVGPGDAQLGRQMALIAAHGALAGSRGAFDVHDHRSGLQRQAAIAECWQGGLQQRCQMLADQGAALLVADQIGDDPGEQLGPAAQAAMLDRDRGADPGERPEGGGDERVGRLRGPLAPLGQGPLLADLDGLRRRRCRPRPSQAQALQQAAGRRRCRRGGPGGQAGGQLLLGQGKRSGAQLRMRRRQRRQLRLDHLAAELPGDLPEIDAEIGIFLAIRHRDVAGDLDQELVDRQALRPKSDQLGGLEAGDGAALLRLGEAGEHVLRPEHGGQRQESGRDLGADAGLPRAESGVGRGRRRGGCRRQLGRSAHPAAAPPARSRWLPR